MIFAVLDYLGTIFGVLFGLLSCGLTLHYISELVEDYPKQSKRIVLYCIRTIIVFHVGIYFVDGMPLFNVILGIAAHLWYGLLVDDFPYIEFSNKYFLGSIAFVIADHFQWFYYFISNPQSFGEILAFFLLLVWLVPLFYFISIVGPENVLPKQADLATSPNVLSPYLAFDGDMTGSSISSGVSAPFESRRTNYGSSTTVSGNKKQSNLFRKLIEIIRPPSPQRSFKSV